LHTWTSQKAGYKLNSVTKLNWLWSQWLVI
jgi:hypothetical protein